MNLRALITKRPMRWRLRLGFGLLLSGLVASGVVMALMLRGYKPIVLTLFIQALLFSGFFMLLFRGLFPVMARRQYKRFSAEQQQLLKDMPLLVFLGDFEDLP